jgi:hypothetical protein
MSDSIQAELFTQIRTGLDQQFGDGFGANMSDDEILELLNVAHEVVSLNPTEDQMEEVRDRLAVAHGYDVASDLENFVVTDPGAAAAVAAALSNHNSIGAPWEDNGEGGYTSILLGMRFTVWPDKLMVTTHSFDPGIVMFDKAPQDFQQLVDKIESEL